MKVFIETTKTFANTVKFVSVPDKAFYICAKDKTKVEIKEKKEYQRQKL